jgi:cation/acetate symporter
MSHALAMFLGFIAITLWITWWAARKSADASAFFAAGRSLTAWQNGIAVAGDYMSAASFLGIAGIIAFQGYDGFMYSVGWLVAYLTVLLIVAEPLRNAGKYTMADVLAYRLSPRPVRAMGALSTLTVSTFYMIAQMVGAGALVSLLLQSTGITYQTAVVGIGVLMIVYVVFGGMLATTWVQIIKAFLLLIGVSLLTVLVLAKFGFNPGNLYEAVVAKYSQTALEPGGLVSSPVEAVSLGLALMFGLLGLPHILMRFYTVPDAKAARKSVLYATGLIGYFYVIIPIVGFGAAVLTPGGRGFITSIDKGGNMAAPILAEQLLGSGFLGFIAAVAFATILAVVAGLTLAGASAYSHDIYVNVIKNGHATEEEQVKAAKTATVIFGIFAVGLGILFKGQNVAFMVGLAFAIAASANFPALLLSIVWKRFTTQGAVWSILVGAFTSIIMILLSPTVWGDVLHHFDAAGKPYGILPWKNPAIFSMTASFLAGWLVSLATADQEAQDKFEDEKLRTYLGVGAE